MNTTFSNWKKWENRNDFQDIKYPGVYALVMTSTNISEEAFSLRKEIVYFGMTNSQGGLKSRLQQFDNTIKGKSGHGGARRFLFKFDRATIEQQLYVSICHQICNVSSNSPSDLRIMGTVASHEYECMAEYVAKFRTENTYHLPKFNDKKNSTKK